MLSGDNSILNRATQAKTNTGLKQIDEKIKLANAAAITRGQGTLDYDVLKEELAKVLGTEGEDWTISAEDTNPWVVTVDGNEYPLSTRGKTGGEEDTGVKDKNGVAIKTTNETTPFLPNPSKNEITNNDLSTGLTIKDENNNEWVWIEVPKTVTQNATTYDDIYNALRGYCEPVITTVTSGSDYKATTCGWTDEWYAWDTTKNEAITEETENLTDTQKALTNGCGLSLSEYNSTKHAMLNSIKDNGGFYIGKYETGIENSYRTYVQGESYFNNNIEYPATEQAVIKQNAYPYNYVTCSQAQNLAKGFATDGKTASLLFGIQWDLVLKFLSVKGVQTNLLNDNSTTWGNYYNNNNTNGTFNITSEHAMASSDYGASYSAITKGTEKSEIKLLTTGSSTSLAKQNIYDLAGNVYEWTLEKASYSGAPCAYRGGCYSDNGDYYLASSRINNNPTLSNLVVGFRVALY